MDAIGLGLFLLATLVGGVTSGIAGFAMGIVVSGMWLHIITPIQTATLIVGYGFFTQGYAIWKLRHALSLRKIAPFLIGGAIGVPIGTALLANFSNPAYLRPAFGFVLVLYSIYGLARPSFRPIEYGLPADLVIGILNGVIGGLTGLTGIAVTIWCQLRGWTRDEQRSVFQPVNLAVIVMTAVSLGVSGVVTVDTVKLFLIGLPVIFVGLWGGFKLYGKLNEATFRRIILVLLLISGVSLILSHIDVFKMWSLTG